MRFAYSSHGTAINQQIFVWLEQALDVGNQAYALLDGSMFKADDIRSLERLSVSIQLALANSPFESYGRQGPLLWPLETADSKALCALLRRADGIPALSFIATPPDAKPLNEVLLWLALSHAEDGQKLYCRFADTRTLPGLLDCLKPEQNVVLGTAIDEWAWIDRDATLQTKSFAPFTGMQLPVPEHFCLDAAQFDLMLTRAEPDMVFQMLAEQMPEVLPDTAPHEIHARLTRLLSTARQRGIVDFPEFINYANIAFLTFDDFDQHPIMQDVWKKIEDAAGRFGELVEQCPDSVWQALQHAASMQDAPFEWKNHA